MGRKKFFLRGLVSSYGLIGFNLLFTLISVPLALHYLSKSEFGIWALVVQLTGYLLLLDLGVSSSLARLLADHKDEKSNPEYASLFYSSFIVAALQAVLMILCGASLTVILPALANIPTELENEFRRLFLLQTVVYAFSLATRPLASPLFAHQRLDVSNLAGGLGLILNLVGLWWGFVAGWGLQSLVWGSALSTLPGLLLPFFVCQKYRYYPAWNRRRLIRFSDFKAVFRLGRDIFLLQLGMQLAAASQVIIVSRWMSVESAAVWSIATKIFTLAQLLGQRVMDASAGALTEMFVRHESAQLEKRFHHVVSLTAWISCVLGGGIALFNSAALSLWTSGKIFWGHENNLLLACLLLSTSVSRVHICIGGIVKDARGLRLVQVVEALVLILISGLLVPQFGFAGLLVASLLGNFGVSLLYGQKVAAMRLGLSFRQVFAWTQSAFACLGALVFLVGISYLWAGPGLHGPGGLFPWIASSLLFALFVGGSYLVCVPADLRKEFDSRFFRRSGI